MIRIHLVIRNGLADPGHESLRKGDAPTAMKSPGIAAIISQMTEIEKAQSVALTWVAVAHKPLRLT
jgi:hypothetical protein